MRVVGHIPHQELKITLFYWNNKYLIKLETPSLEQTFKIPEADILQEEDLNKIVNEPFIRAAIERFNSMAASLHQGLEQV